MNKLLSVFLVSLIVTACGQKTDSSSTSIEEGIEKQYIEQAKAALSKDLKDPSSAQFINVRLINGGEVCGEVNAKNSLGGYVGFQRFHWFNFSPDSALMISPTSTACQ